MNHIFRVVWNQVSRTWQAVTEKARGHSKASQTSSVAALATVAAFGLAGAAHAQLPTGGNIVAGSGSIASTGNVMTITQATDRMATNWSSFSIGQGNTVNFVQPSSSAISLNRVIGSEQSLINGALNANGQVFLLNSQGVLFGKDAQVNVGGLVASTLNLSDADFMAGKRTFISTGNNGRILNLGTLNAQDGGYIVLMGQNVSNEGLISARLGTVAMAAGEKVSLNFNGNSLVGVTIDQGVLGALVENKNAVIADGGLVVLTAKGLDEVMATVVNNTGEIRAQTIGVQEGKIYLLGGMDNNRIEVGGKLDASAPISGNGGFIETSAHEVKLSGDLKVKASSAHGKNGQWLIDPTDYTIGATEATAIQNALDDGSGGGTDTTIETLSTGTGAGNINVNHALSWSTPTTLTLKAHNDINVNQNITATDTSAGVIFLYGQAAAEGGTSSFNQANTATISVASQQWRKGSDLDSIRYAIVNGEVFLGGKYIELGITADGYFGTRTAPSLFYGRQGGNSGIGMTGAANGFANSYDKTTSSPTSADLRIDYFLPGSPFENTAFGQSGATTAEMNYRSRNFPATTVRLQPLGADNILKAKITSTQGDLEVTQMVALEKGAKYFNNDVTLKNIGTSALTDVVYSRNFDPDNTIDIGGQYDTIQKIDKTIAAGDSITIVSATSISGDPYATASGGQQSVIFFATTDSRVKPGIDTDWSTNSNFWGSDIAAMRTQMATQVKGTTTVGQPAANPDGSFDGAMGFVFSGGNVAAGASVNFNYNTVLAMGTVAEVVVATPSLGGGGSTSSSIPESLIASVARTAIAPPAFIASTSLGSALSPIAPFCNVSVVPPSLSAAFGAGARLAVISSPKGEEPTQAVSLSEVRSIMTCPCTSESGDAAPAPSTAEDVCVPVSRNSLADILNGGVKLPDGVEQQLFVVQGN